jgi:hypothetical protein
MEHDVDSSQNPLKVPTLVSMASADGHRLTFLWPHGCELAQKIPADLPRRTRQLSVKEFVRELVSRLEV